MKLFDLHCDTISECLSRKMQIDENSLHISLKKGKYFQSWIQCFAVWLPDNCRGQNAIELVNQSIDFFEQQLERYSDQFFLCKTKKDIETAALGNKIGAVLTLEGSAALGGDLNQLEKLFARGVRVITLTWNGKSEVGDGSLVKNPTGLSDFGRKLLSKMEALGIVVDVSHASLPLFDDVLEICTKPVIATHSNSFKVYEHPRNLTDRQFTMIKNTGGLVGLTFCRDFLRHNGKEATMNDILLHAEHFLEIGGERTLCLGSDFDGADMPDGIADVESVQRVYELFLKHYKQEIVDAIFFENAYRFVKS